MIYFDYAASTPTDKRVLAELLPYFEHSYANPSSLHSQGVQSHQLIEESSKTISTILNCKSDELIYTSGGTEGNNLALLGAAKAVPEKKHIITTVIEHSSILGPLSSLQKQGYEITQLPVDQNGNFSLDELAAEIRSDTLLFSTSYGNSEIGVLPPVTDISRICAEHEILFHLDACQAGAYLPINVQALGCDLLTLSGNKLYALKGTGLLYIKGGTPIMPILFGGGQQQSLRSGTENVCGVLGLAKALSIAQSEQDEYVQIIYKYRQELEDHFRQLGATINSPTSSRLPNHLSVTLRTNSTNLVKDFDQLGICLSSGSACGSKTISTSHVLASIGRTQAEANKTVRITLGKNTTQKEIEALKKAATRLSVAASPNKAL